MATKARAVVRDGVFYREEAARVAAPYGEYEICRTCDGAVSFSHCGDARCFTLSFDALQQHVAEGRIVLKVARIPAAEA
ncbi:MAG: hypothetical protein R3C54_14345 [Parvularculaceae bacterium]